MAIETKVRHLKEEDHVVHLIYGLLTVLLSIFTFGFAVFIVLPSICLIQYALAFSLAQISGLHIWSSVARKTHSTFPVIGISKTTQNGNAEDEETTQMLTTYLQLLQRKAAMPFCPKQDGNERTYSLNDAFDECYPYTFAELAMLSSIFCIIVIAMGCLVFLEMNCVLGDAGEIFYERLGSDKFAESPSEVHISNIAECSHNKTAIPTINLLTLHSDDQWTQTDKDRRTPPPPISTPKWSTATHFSTSGGTLHSEESDVILHVPNKAINSHTYIDIYSTVCANEARIRELVPFQRGAVLASPLAEFFVEEEFQFQRPVWITLPHCLPPNPDLQQVRVYRLFRNVDGSVNVHRLRCSSTTENADDGLIDEDGVEWETVVSFRFQDEKLLVFTSSFSGYVCLYCGQTQLPSVLYLLANVSLKKKRRSGEHSAAVSLHVWDRRLEIKDFQKEYGIPMSADATRQTTIRLTDEHTQLMTRLELSGDSGEQWRFCVRLGSLKPTTDIIQSHVLVDAIVCTNGHCGRPSHPQTSSWRLESCGPCQNGCSFECVIDVCTATLQNASQWPSKSDEKGPCLQIPLEVFVDEPTSVMEEADFKDVHADSQSVGHMSGGLHQTFPKQAVFQSKISNEILGRRFVQDESDSKIEISRSMSPLQNNHSPRNATGGKLELTHNRFPSSDSLTTKEPTSASNASSNDGLRVPYRRSTPGGDVLGWEDFSSLSS